MKQILLALALVLSATAGAQGRLQPMRPVVPGDSSFTLADQAIDATRRLSMMTAHRAYSMNPNDLTQVLRLLQSAEALVMGPPIGSPQGPTCQLQGYGDYRGYSWNYLITLDGKTLDASNDFSEALTKLSSLQSSGICVRPFSPQDTCELAGYNSYRGYSWNYLIKVKNEIIEANNDFSIINSRLKGLEQAGVCRPMAEQKCSLQGYGAYRGYSWNFRVLIGSEIVDAFNNSEESTARLTELRRLNLCF